VPTDGAFTVAFYLCAGVAALAAVLALFIPPTSHGHLPPAVEAAAGAPLGEAAYAGWSK
jgi:hypothetical protein